MRRVFCFAFLMAGSLGAARAGDPKDEKPPSKAFGLDDLLALTSDVIGDAKPYRADDYLKAAVALQALGKDEACKLLLRQAQKDDWPSTRTLILCRMLFKAKPNGVFRGAAVGASEFVKDDSKEEDWPGEPIHIEDGVPFLIVATIGIAGRPESATDYVKYCMTECEWNDFKYELKSKEQKRKALDGLVERFRLKGQREFFEKQIK